MYVVCFICIYIHRCNMHVHVFQREHWWTLVSSWPNKIEKVGQPGEKNILEKKYKTTDKLLNYIYFLFILVLLIYFKYVLFYITPRYFYTTCTRCLLYSSLSFNYIGSHSFLCKTSQVRLEV